MLTYEEVELLSYSFDSALVRKSDFSLWRIRLAESPESIQVVYLGVDKPNDNDYYLTLEQLNEKFIVSAKSLAFCKKNKPKQCVVYQRDNKTQDFLEPCILSFYEDYASQAFAKLLLTTIEEKDIEVKVKEITVDEYKVLVKFLSKL